MKRLKWWMIAVGVFYVADAVTFLPFLKEGTLTLMIPRFTAPPDSIEFKALVDWMMVFGLDLGVIGAMLLYASREPLKHVILVQTVIGLELVRGVLADIYGISRAISPPEPYVGFIILHLVIIGTGLIFLRQATTQRSMPAVRSTVGATH